jgi:hypothetical protein
MGITRERATGVGFGTAFCGVATALVLIEAISRLHVEPRGQQIHTLFKTERMAPFDPAYLESTRELVARHAQLEKKTVANARGR